MRRAGREADRAAELWFGGDVHFGDGALSTLPFVGVGVVNLEGPIAAGAATPERLVNASASAASLPDAGVRVAWIENDHADDDGEAGRSRTTAELERVGVAAAGVAVVPLGGRRVVFMGVGSRQGRARRRLRRRPRSRRRAGGRLSRHRAAGAAASGGVSRSRCRSRSRTAPRSWFAHGTHAVARVERVGPAVVAWGLGNLAFACPCTTEKDGLVLEVELDADAHVAAAWAVPVTAGLRAGTVVVDAARADVPAARVRSPVRRWRAGRGHGSEPRRASARRGLVRSMASRTARSTAASRT